MPSASIRPLFITDTEGPSPTLLFSRPTTATSWGSWLWETSASLWPSSKASKNCRGSRPPALPWKKLERQQSRAVTLQWNTNSWPASTTPLPLIHKSIDRYEPEKFTDKLMQISYHKSPQGKKGRFQKPAIFVFSCLRKRINLKINM